MRAWQRLFRTPKPPTPVNVHDGYALWAADYAAKAHNPLMALEETAVHTLLPSIQNKQCLDLACGSGRYLHWLQQNGAALALGTDLSWAMLQAAVAGPLLQCPFYPLPFADNSFDLIICGLAVGHSPDLARPLQAAARVLRPGGSLVYSDFHPFAALSGWERTFTAADGTTYALEHYTHLYQDHVQACASAGLHIEAVQEPMIDNQIPVVLALRARKTNL